MTQPGPLTRRQLLLAATVLTPVAARAATPTSYANIQRLSQDDPVARSLLYIEDTRQVPAEHPLAASHKPENKCANCVHLRGKTADSWRPCPVFPGRLVNAGGWCSVWASS
jgi:hypothetical protein